MSPPTKQCGVYGCDLALDDAVPRTHAAFLQQALGPDALYLILHLLNSHTVTTAEMIDAHKLSQSTLHRVLRRMGRFGLIECLARGQWQLIDPAHLQQELDNIADKTGTSAARKHVRLESDAEVRLHREILSGQRDAPSPKYLRGLKKFAPSPPANAYNETP